MIPDYLRAKPKTTSPLASSGIFNQLLPKQTTATQPVSTAKKAEPKSIFAVAAQDFNNETKGFSTAKKVEKPLFQSGVFNQMSKTTTPAFTLEPKNEVKSIFQGAKDVFKRTQKAVASQLPDIMAPIKAFEQARVEKIKNPVEVRQRLTQSIQDIKPESDFLSKAGKRFASSFAGFVADAADNYVITFAQQAPGIVAKQIMPSLHIWKDEKGKPLLTPEMNSLKQKSVAEWDKAVEIILDTGLVPTHRAKEFTDKLKQADFMQPDKDWANAPLSEKITSRLGQTLYELSPAAVASFAAYAINPAAGSAVIGGSVADGLVGIAKENGMSDREARVWAIAPAVGVTLLDRIVPARIFARQAPIFFQGFARRVGQAIIQFGERMFLEGGTEFGQEVLQIAAESTIRHDLTLNEAQERVALSTLMGAFTGGFMDSFVRIARTTAEMKPKVGFTVEDVAGKVPKDDTQLTPEQQAEIKESIESMTIEEVGQAIKSKVETFRKEADLMAKPYEGMSRIEYETPSGVFSAYSQGKLRSKMAGQAQDMRAEADRLLYENDPVYRALKDFYTSKLGTEQTELYQPSVPDFGTDTRSTAEIQMRPTRSEIQQAIEMATKRETAEMISRRETTLLKSRIQALARGSRIGAMEARAEARSVQAELRNIIKQAQLAAKDRESFSDMLKNVQTVSQLQQKIPEIEARIKAIEMRVERTELLSDIKKTLKDTVPIKGGKFPKGKYTPEIQRILDVARGAGKLTESESNKIFMLKVFGQASDIVNMSRVEARQKLAENREKYASQIATGDLSPEIALENSILTRRIATNKELRSLVEEIKAMKEHGRIMGELRKFNIATTIQRDLGVVADVIPDVDTRVDAKLKGRIKKFVAGFGHNFLLSWLGKMESLGSYSDAGDTRMLKTFEILSAENKFKELRSQTLSEMTGAVANVYGIDTKKKTSYFTIAKKLRQFTKEINYGKVKYADGLVAEMRLTRSEAMYYHQQFKDVTLDEGFEKGNKFTPEIKQMISDSLTAEEKQLAQKMVDIRNEFYPIVNDVYKQMNGMNMGFIKDSLPVRREGFKEDPLALFGEFLQEATTMPAVGAKGMMARTKNELAIAKQDIFQALNLYFQETSYYVAFAEKIRNFRAVFGNTEVRTRIKEMFGNNFLTSIDDGLKKLASNGKNAGKKIKSIDWARKNFTIGALMLKPAIFAKQTLSLAAYLEVVNPIDFTAAIADFAIHGVRNTRILNEESTFLRERMHFKERDIEDALNSREFKMFSQKQTWQNLAMMNVALGDKLPILIGSWAIRQKRLKALKGKATPEQMADIVAEYSNFGQETQQSSDIGRLADYQRAGSFAELFTMFLSTPRAYLQKEILAIKSMMRDGGVGRKNLQKVARTLVIYHVVLPVIFQMMARGFRWDDESKRDYLRAAILGNLNSLPLLKGILDSIVSRSLNLQVWDGGVPIEQVSKDILRFMKAIDPENISLSDWHEAVRGLSGVGQSVGLPSKTLFLMYEGAQKIIENDDKRGVANILGWSDYALGIPKEKTPKQKRDAAIKMYKILLEKGDITELEAVKGLEKELKKINKAELKKYGKELLELTPEESADKLKKMVAKGTISAENAADLLVDRLKSNPSQLSVKELIKGEPSKKAAEIIKKAIKDGSLTEEEGVDLLTDHLKTAMK